MLLLSCLSKTMELIRFTAVWCALPDPNTLPPWTAAGSAGYDKTPRLCPGIRLAIVARRIVLFASGCQSDKSLSALHTQCHDTTIILLITERNAVCTCSRCRISVLMCRTSTASNVCDV